MKVTMVQVPVG